MNSVLHVVLVRWRDNTPHDIGARIAEHAEAFPSTIPGVLEVAHGPSVSTENLEAGYQWALVVTFADSESRDGYLVHAAHTPVSDLIGAWAEQLAVFDVAK